MTAGIAGSGPYAKQRDLRFQIQCLKRDLENKPMGPRIRKQKEKFLLHLQSELRELNRKIREEKK
jgi:hypothetical protein